MASTLEEGEGTVGDTLEGRRGGCSGLPVSSELELRKIDEGNELLAVVVNEYDERVKNFGKKGKGEELNRLALL